MHMDVCSHSCEEREKTESGIAGIDCSKQLNTCIPKRMSNLTNVIQQKKTDLFRYITVKWKKPHLYVEELSFGESVPLLAQFT